VQGAGRHHTVAGAGLVGQVDQVAAQDVVAGVAAVVPTLDTVVVGPRRTELLARVPGLRGASFTASVSSFANAGAASNTGAGAAGAPPSEPVPGSASAMAKHPVKPRTVTAPNASRAVRGDGACVSSPVTRVTGGARKYCVCPRQPSQRDGLKCGAGIGQRDRAGGPHKSSAKYADRESFPSAGNYYYVKHT
jgi:hypothetical protein